MRQAHAFLLDPHIVAVVIPPAAFFHEKVPDEDFLVIGNPTMLVAPSEDLLVGLIHRDVMLDFRIVNREKSAAASVETSADVGMIFLRQ